MENQWTQSYIQQLIDDQVQESLTLEYKAAAALRRDSKQVNEIVKDVSAMANSAGGIIIYGIAEDRQGNLRVPDRIDPVNQGNLSKEWLEHVIGTVRPKIQGLGIYPVALSHNANEVVYVVDVPQSTTAHQATDKKYYKRYNFEAVPMDDHEIRDVMGRQQYPKITLDFAIDGPLPGDREYKLIVTARNVGMIYAMYVNCFIDIPVRVLPDYLTRLGGDYLEFSSKDGVEYYRLVEKNTYRDLIRVDYTRFGKSKEERGPTRYDPILPGLVREWEVKLSEDFESQDRSQAAIHWVVYADNAPPVHGTTPLNNIHVRVR